VHSIVGGAIGLAKLAGVVNLRPSLATIEKIVEAQRQGAELDREAASVYSRLVRDYITSRPDGMKQITDLYQANSESVDANARLHMFAVWKEICDLPVSSEARENLIQAEHTATTNIREQQNEFLSTIGKIFAVAAASVAVLLAGGAAAAAVLEARGNAEKNARLPTIGEQIRGRKL
jgi:hypothetical protein